MGNYNAEKLTVNYADLANTTNAYIALGATILLILTGLAILLTHSAKTKTHTKHRISGTLILMLAAAPGAYTINEIIINPPKDEVTYSAEHSTQREQHTLEAMKTMWDIEIHSNSTIPHEVKQQEYGIVGTMRETQEPAYCTAATKPAEDPHSLTIELWCNGWPAPTK